MDKRELPMYKDKPYSYAASRRYTPPYRQWRVIGGAVLVLIGLGYWFGFFSPSAVKPMPRGSGKSPWNFWRSPALGVDWDGRREKVREAFMLSWDGYEQYAWGVFALFFVLSLL